MSPNHNPQQDYQDEFQQEQTRAVYTVDQVKKYKALLEKTLNYIGEENLRKLKDLRDNAESNPTDLFMFMEQLHSQNQAFNFKDKIKQLEEMSYLLNEPYFSRIDLLDPTSSRRDELYIGRFGLTTDTTTKPLITDWRAKIASVYYKYRYPQKNVRYDTQDGTVTRDLTLKRTFEFDAGTLLKFYNNDIQLDENELIGQKIAKRSGGVLEDIVATIQESQMEIIEYDPRGVCIVQGCVGSGKSTVAIHKLSHIFFNYPNLIHPQSSLLVAKNQILVGYLSTLFPKLGIFDLNYGTLKDLLVRLTFSHELKIQLALDDESGTESVDLNQIDALREALSQIKSQVVQQIAGLENNPDYSSYFTFVYDDDLSVQENILAIIDDLEEEIKYQKERLDEGITGVAEARSQTTIKNIKTLIKEVRKSSNNLRASVFPALLKSFDIDAKKPLRYKSACVYMFLYSQVFGLAKFKKFEYCVVDEGQDFSALEYLVLNSLVIKGRFCILGDLNQSYLKSGLAKWESIEAVITEAKQCKKFDLTTNYRSTKPIIDYACGIISAFTADFLPQSINRKGPEVQVIRHSSETEGTSTNNNFTNKGDIPNANANANAVHTKPISTLLKAVDEDVASLDKSIGIICFNKSDFETIREILESKYRAKLNERLVVLNPKDRIFYTPKGVYLTLFENCKGLEFAKVYVVGMNEHPKDLHEAKMNYVAVTRAMNELVIFPR